MTAVPCTLCWRCYSLSNTTINAKIW